MGKTSEGDFGSAAVTRIFFEEDHDKCLSFLLALLISIGTDRVQSQAERAGFRPRRAFFEPNPAREARA